MGSQGSSADFFIHVPKLGGGAPALHVSCSNVQRETVQFLLDKVKVSDFQPSTFIGSVLCVACSIVFDGAANLRPLHAT